MHRRKLLITVIALAASLVTLLSQSTLAYYAVSGDAVNTVTAGEISIRIVERMGGNELTEEGITIMPGRVISKQLSVKNIGTNPCWLRLKLTNGIDDESLSPDVLELDMNAEDWIAADDGYYYYRAALQPGAETEPLYRQIKISGKADKSYAGKSLKLTIVAYAVQSEYNDAGSPLQVSGWPAES